MKYKIILTLILFPLTLSAEVNKSKISIVMSEKSLVTGHFIRLGDIASIGSSDEDDSEQLSKLKDVCIGPSPEPGYSQTIHRGYVRSRVQQDGFPADAISWDGSQQTVVEAKALHVSPQQLISYAEKFIADRISNNQSGLIDKESSKICIRPLNEIRPAVLPYGELEIKVESMSAQLPNGVQNLVFTISVDGQNCERRIIPFKLEILREVLVAARILDRHKVIGEEDLRKDLRDIVGLSSFYTESIEIIGKRTTRAIPVGVPITSDIIEVLPVIHRDDLITIVIESPNFRITTQGKAREDGAQGQIIRVVNTSSMKEICAQVIDNKSVRVEFKYGFPF